MEGLSEFLTGLGDSFTRTFLLENRWRLVLSGLRVTVVISLFSLIFGTVLGALVCAMRRGKIEVYNIKLYKVTSAIAKIFIRVVQGMPIIVMLMMLYYVVFARVDIDAMVVAVIGFSMNFAAYTSEMFRTGIDTVDKGQQEAAAASGFSKFRTFTLIVLPQAARHVIPVFKGEFVSMVKMTSVVGYIAIQDLTKVSDIIRSRTYEAFFPLIATAVIYFAVTYLFILILNSVEFKIDPKSRKRVVRGVAPR
jgi:polar amino acid transport system substrate-binding protein